MNPAAAGAIGMVLVNAMSIAFGLLAEGRIKAGAAQFMVMYAMTVRPAVNGDPEPFLTVLCMPPR